MPITRGNMEKEITTMACKKCGKMKCACGGMVKKAKGGMVKKPGKKKGC